MEANVLVGVTGSVAAIKVPELVQRLTEYEDKKVGYGFKLHLDSNVQCS